MLANARVLIIRFSSFGDIFQALEAAKHLSLAAPESKPRGIDWLVREDFAALLHQQNTLDDVHVLNRKASPLELVKLVWKIAPRYTHVYDAHSNLRSLIVRTTIRFRWLADSFRKPLTENLQRSIIVRSKERLRRFLFFRLRLPTLPAPYRGAESFVRPLRKWIPDLDFNFSLPGWTAPAPHATAKRDATGAVSVAAEFHAWRSNRKNAPLIALAPSAAWPNKRWPVDRWRLFVQEWLKIWPESHFLLLGGPDDRFLDDIEKEFGSSLVFNAVGKVSLLESSVFLSEADALVANDTGLLHVADRLLMPAVAIIGPTAFGYPVSPISRVAEVPRGSLYCKPCSKDGRDPCINAVKLKCLLDVSPQQVARELKESFESLGESQALS